LRQCRVFLLPNAQEQEIFTAVEVGREVENLHHRPHARRPHRMTVDKNIGSRVHSREAEEHNFTFVPFRGDK